MSIRRFTAFSTAALVLAIGSLLAAQTREKGPWWPSPHGPKDQAGNSNLITPEKIMKALRIPKTGQAYELGHIYEPGMPQYGNRPFYLITHQAPAPQKEGRGLPSRSTSRATSARWARSSTPSVIRDGLFAWPMAR